MRLKISRLLTPILSALLASCSGIANEVDGVYGRIEFFPNHADLTTSIGSSVAAPATVDRGPRTFVVGDVVNLNRP